MEDFKKLEKQRLKKLQRRIRNDTQQYVSARINEHDIYVPTENDQIKLGAVGDTHLCSKLSNEKGIKEWFRQAQYERGFSLFLHPGDVIDGMFIYPEQHLHLKVLGIEEQAEYAAEFFDKVLDKKSHMYIINGNHELGGRRGVYQCYGIDPAKMIAQKLPDKITYLGNSLGGNMFARVNLTTGEKQRHPRVKVDMVHTRRYVGNQPGSTSEVLLKGHILGYQPEERPDILLINHTHRKGHVEWQNCHALLCSAFEFPNNYTARLNHGSEQGSYLLYLDVGDAGLKSVSPRYISVYKGI